MQKKYDYVLKYVIIGSSSVGKSSILKRFADDEFEDSYISTIGIDFRFKSIMVGDSYVKLQIWDTAGQERFRGITKSYYKGAQAIILVYDINNEKSFEDIIEYWLKACSRLHLRQQVRRPQSGHQARAPPHPQGEASALLQGQRQDRGGGHGGHPGHHQGDDHHPPQDLGGKAALGSAAVDGQPHDLQEQVLQKQLTSSSSYVHSFSIHTHSSPAASKYGYRLDLIPCTSLAARAFRVSALLIISSPLFFIRIALMSPTSPNTFSSQMWPISLMASRSSNYTPSYSPILRVASPGINGSVASQRPMSETTRGCSFTSFFSSYLNPFCIWAMDQINEFQNQSQFIPIAHHYIQMKRLSFVDCPNKCRPLIAADLNGDDLSFVSMPYNYEVNDVKELEGYLCPGVRVVGVDFQSKPQPMPKLKYKRVCVAGKDVEKSQTITTSDKYERLDWEVDVAITLPFAIRPGSGELKSTLAASLFLFKKQGNKELPVNSEIITLADLKACKICCIAASGASRKPMKGRSKQKVLVNRIPVGFLVPRLDSYPRKEIILMVASDLAKAINIMTQSEMLLRVVARHEGDLPIQTYVKGQTEQDPTFNKLIKRKADREPAPKITQKLESSIAMGQNKSSNGIKLVFLVSALVALVGAYVALRFF